MADQRQGFRFRLPWLTGAAAAPRLAPPQPPRPAAQTKAPAQPTTTPTQAPTQPTATTQTQTQTPAQRPPFRPAGIAQTQPPPQAPPPTRTEGQTAPQSRPVSQTKTASPTTNESRASSLPSSPSRTTTQTRAPSTPSSPSRAASQVRPTSQTAPKPQSPSPLASQSAGRTSSQPTSQSNKPSEDQPTSQESSRPSSPSKKLQSTTQENSQPPSSASQQQKSKPTGFQPLPKDPQPQTELKTETVASSGNQTSKETNFPIPRNEVAPPQPAQALGPAKVTPRKPAESQKLDDGQISIDHSEFLPESKRKPKGTGEKVVEESIKEENANDQAYEQPMQRTITQFLTAASGSATQNKELHTVAFQAERKQHGKQVNTVSSRHPKVRHTETESHQKPIMSNGERAPLHKEVRNDISKLVHKLAPGHIKEPINDKPVSIVTLVGENRGATMQLGSESAKKDGLSVHIHRGYKLQPDESPEATTDGEESFRGRSKDPMTKEDQAMEAYLNNNVQSINNSIVFDACVTERNPGVQLVLSNSPTEPVKPSTKAEPPTTSKAEFRVTPAEKLTYQPIIRRRCLRGLLMESSDSDPDNPEKPRRHGCRYSCREKSIDKDIGIL